jgi:hypothetical protein
MKVCGKTENLMGMVNRFMEMVVTMKDNLKKELKMEKALIIVIC